MGITLGVGGRRFAITTERRIGDGFQDVEQRYGECSGHAGYPSQD